jgi:hypothetical protein
LHGEFKEFRPGFHTGNQVRMTIWNDGQVGTKELQPDIIALEWPINSGFTYFGQSMIKVGSEVIDVNGDLVHIFSESNGWRPQDPNDPGTGDEGPDGEWYTLLPLPGFAHPESNRLAMSQWRWSWPPFWPDKTDDAVDPGWPGSWNGYFGKNVMNADQESYFVCDDYNNKEFAFYPDSLDLNRRGLGMRITARGLQWSNALVEDIVFALYDVKNIGTSSYKKMLFAQFVGAAIGNKVNQGGDNGDDDAAFDIRESLVYNFDPDNLGVGGYTPVGYYGAAFLESPGNPYDGIDNDYDANSGGGKIITEELFAPKQVRAGDDIIKVDYKTYARTKIQMPADTLRIPYMDRELKFWPGEILEELPHNLVDDNLNGIIDESNGSTFEAEGQSVTTFLYVGATCIDYFDGTGLNNSMIDEYRDDGIDNDGNWNPILDDLGLDGVPFTGDFGEGDGKPTSGWQRPGVVPEVQSAPNKFGLVDTELPGEPHIDKTDIVESDMIGLTSFYLYSPWSLLPGSNDELIWEKTKPGYLNDKSKPADTDFTFGSGYFPMVAGQIERYSIAHVMGWNLDDLIINKRWADRAYQENYNFSKAPNIPTLRAVAGNGQVTLLWDDFAEKSVDPITGKDFEGYKIYRSTDPGFNDMAPITDGYGTSMFQKPLAQFDLENEYRGYSPVHIKGTEFWLGDNTGLVHSYVDSTAKNGFLYYYAITSYDHGDPSKLLSPSECSKYIAISPSGAIDKGTNVVIVRPEAPSAGFLPSGLDSLRLVVRPEGVGTATGQIGYSVVDPTAIKDGHVYRVTFGDTLVDKSIAGSKQWTYITKDFTLVDATAGDTLIARSEDVLSTDEQPLTDGFQLKLYGDSALVYDASRSAGWSRREIQAYLFAPYRVVKETTNPEAADYRIEFGELGLDTSTEITSRNKPLAAIPVNFKVWKLLPTDTGEVALECRFAFREQDGKDGVFSAFGDKNHTKVDEIIILNEERQPGFQFSLDRLSYDSLKVLPEAGDVVTLRLRKPFMRHDVYEFTARQERLDEGMARAELDKIKVVPNPYVATNSWEPLNPYSSGRGPRELHFTHLPSKCTIKIFNVRGQLVAELSHETPSIANGTEIWNMQTKDQLDIAYGVYVYHVDAGSLGQKVGKFAVIK